MIRITFPTLIPLFIPIPFLFLFGDGKGDGRRSSRFSEARGYCLNVSLVILIFANVFNAFFKRFNRLVLTMKRNFFIPQVE